MTESDQPLAGFAGLTQVAKLNANEAKEEAMSKFCCCQLRRLLGVFLSSVVFVGGAIGQELIGIKIEPAEATVGKPVQITVDLKASTVTNGACGLVINFGDGTSQAIRVENNSLPVAITRTYSGVGAVSVVAEGKLYVRGLRSVLGCFGPNQSIALNVRAEDPTVEEAAELAAKNAAVKRATADKVAAELAAKSAAADRSAT